MTIPQHGQFPTMAHGFSPDQGCVLGALTLLHRPALHTPKPTYWPCHTGCVQASKVQGKWMKPLADSLVARPTIQCCCWKFQACSHHTWRHLAQLPPKKHRTTPKQLTLWPRLARPKKDLVLKDVPGSRAKDMRTKIPVADSTKLSKTMEITCGWSSSAARYWPWNDKTGPTANPKHGWSKWSKNHGNSTVRPVIWRSSGLDILTHGSPAMAINLEYSDKPMGWGNIGAHKNLIHFGWILCQPLPLMMSSLWQTANPFVLFVKSCLFPSQPRHSWFNSQLRVSQTLSPMFVATMSPTLTPALDIQWINVYIYIYYIYI